MKTKYARLIAMAALFMLVLLGCKPYKKGDLYELTSSSDSTRFIVRKSGGGNSILKMVEQLQATHTNRMDEYNVRYLSDSQDVAESRAVLLFHSELPDFEDDMLSKGYLGAFGTKEIVTYMVVTYDDFEAYFEASE